MHIPADLEKNKYKFTVIGCRVIFDTAQVKQTKAKNQRHYYHNNIY